jgi:Vitamin B6 photo-protection and homoeostasis
MQRFFSQMNMMFATQSLLYALGIGASKTLAASAAVNWMLKEGLGKAARMAVSTSFAQNLDCDIKVRHNLVEGLEPLPCACAAT